MGKDYKHKDLGKARRGVIGWDDVSEETKKMMNRENYDIGEYRKRKEKKKEKASKKEMERQIKDYENKKGC